MADKHIVTVRIQPPIFQIINDGIANYREQRWSREAPPCHIAVVGLRHPLREPYVPFSEYTALLLLVQTKLTFCG